MNTAAFETELAEAGYGDIVTKEGEPSTVNQPHQHDFAVRGLVISGEFTLTKEGTPTTYVSGDTFSMEPNCSHTEGHGPTGSKYILGRKHL
jgi:quercetin dioxygenase-like cupin family protein